MKKEIETIYPKSRAEWRAWLEENHHVETSVWLLYYKKKTNLPSLAYSDAVEEALCFGWIDSKTQSLGEDKYRQFFCRRKPNSVWSKVNKAKVEQLINEGLFTQAGFDSIETARQNGSWSILDEVEALIIPDDLAAAFAVQPDAQSYFGSLSRTDRRNILQWLVLAKRPETRQNRIREIVFRAAQSQKPKPF